MKEFNSTLPKYTDTVIIGAGLGGIGMGIGLQKAGLSDYIIIEKSTEVGGTWRDNSYPGCACDVQSHLYSYSFTDKSDWSKRYAPWNEIQDYILGTVSEYNVRPNVRFGLEVNSAVFDEKSATWTVGTMDGQTIQCRYFVLATGPLHVPQFPKIKGLESFKGKVMHSAQWDHNYDLRGKKVASIGTGGSAIQYVPEIAPEVEHIDVYQRTAAWVIPRDERPYSAASKWIFKNIPSLRRLYRSRLYFTNEMRVWPIFNETLAKGVEFLAKRFINMQVKDPETRAKLTPDYTIGCKRILISNKWYKTFNRKNVGLVTDGIQEIRENSIVDKNGVERECDTIILGTGFIVDPRGYMDKFNLKGLPGRDILEDWKDGAEAYLGNTVTGYPNMFQLVGPNSGLGHNSIIFMIEAQIHYILESMKEAKARGVDYLNVKKSAQDDFNNEIQERIKGSVWTSGCSSWYQQDDGKNFVLWPYSTLAFWRRNKNVITSHYDWVKIEAQPASSNNASASKKDTGDAISKADSKATSAKGSSAITENPEVIA